MNKPPFFVPPAALLQTLTQALPPPPDWLQDELRNRLVLLLNHVLMQEPPAMERLRRQQGKTVHLVWGAQSLNLQASPAGLLALAAAGGEPDLCFTVFSPSVWTLLQSAWAGQKPAIDIQGDAQLATDVNWLVDHVRWDVEEDLSRFTGDAVAHSLVTAVKAVAQGLRQFVVKRQPDNAPVFRSPS